MSLTTKLPTYLYSFQAGSTQIVCPLSERRYGNHIDIFTPFGFSGFSGTGEYPAFSQEWKQYARSKGWVCGYIGLHPLFYTECHYCYHDLFTENELFYLDLSRSKVELYSRLSRSRKRQIRSWDASGDWICNERGRLTDFIIANAPAFFASRGASKTYEFSRETWQMLLALPNATVIGAQKRGKVVAATVFVHAGAVAEALFNISLPEGRDAATLLMWTGALHLQSLGITMLNMGGGVQQGDSVAAAKRQFGAQVLPLRSLKQIYDGETYKAICREIGKSAEDRTGFFPPYQAMGRL